MRRRIATLQMLLKAGCLSNEPERPNLVNEFEEVIRVNHLEPLRRRALFQVLFSSRALDTSLAVFLRNKGIAIPNQSRNLRGYLHLLLQHRTHVGSITYAEYTGYQHRIVRPRNRYMHEAGASPAGSYEVMCLLNEMHSCLARVLGL